MRAKRKRIVHQYFHLGDFVFLEGLGQMWEGPRSPRRDLPKCHPTHPDSRGCLPAYLHVVSLGHPVVGHFLRLPLRVLQLQFRLHVLDFVGRRLPMFGARLVAKQPRPTVGWLVGWLVVRAGRRTARPRAARSLVRRSVDVDGGRRERFVRLRLQSSSPPGLRLLGLP